MRCIVKNCSSTNKRKDSKESFFSFPTDPAVLKEWIKFCKRDFKFNVKTAAVCNLHFKADDIENALQYEMGFTSRKLLKRGAIPSIAPGEVEQIEKPSSKEIVGSLLQELDPFSALYDAKELFEDQEVLNGNDTQFTVEVVEENIVNIGLPNNEESKHSIDEEKQSTLLTPTQFDNNENIETQINGRMCAFLSASMDFSVYNINCFYCKDVFQIYDWPNFVRHMQDNHYKSEYLKNVDDVLNDDAAASSLAVKQNSCEQSSMYLTSEALKKENNTTENECDPLDVDSLTTPQLCTLNFTIDQKVCNEDLQIIKGESEIPPKQGTKRKRINIDEMSSKIKKPTPQLISSSLNIETIEPSSMLCLLELMRSSNPLLWFIPTNNFGNYMYEVKKLCKAFNEKQELQVPFTSCLANFIQNIIKWHIQIKEIDGKDELMNPLIDYYNKCTEFLPDKLDGSKTCEICQENFPDALQYFIHKHQIHNETNDFEQLKDANKMKEYVDARWHKCLRQSNHFECKLCNTIWPLKPTKGKKEIYFNHMKGHANLPQFVCDSCGKSYRRWNVFVMHRRRHTGLIPRVCLICEKSFNSYWDLTLHRRAKHRPIEGTIEEIESRSRPRASKYKFRVSPKTSKKRLICPYCKKDYSSHSSLYIHNQRYHKSEWTADRFKEKKVKAGFKILRDELKSLNDIIES